MQHLPRFRPQGSDFPFQLGRLFQRLSITTFFAGGDLAVERLEGVGEGKIVLFQFSDFRITDSNILKSRTQPVQFLQDVAQLENRFGIFPLRWLCGPVLEGLFQSGKARFDARDPLRQAGLDLSGELRGQGFQARFHLVQLLKQRSWIVAADHLS